jgi:hypothetical protein
MPMLGFFMRHDDQPENHGHNVWKRECRHIENAENGSILCNVVFLGWRQCSVDEPGRFALGMLTMRVVQVHVRPGLKGQ